MGQEECAFDVTAIWILTLAIENFHVMIIVIEINSPIECQENHLRNLIGFGNDNKWRVETIK